MHQKSTSAGAPPQTSPGPGSLQRSSRPSSWNKGDLLLSEGEKYMNEKGRCRQGMGEDERGEGNGGDPPYVGLPLNFP